MMTNAALLEMTPETVDTVTGSAKTTLENIEAKMGFVPAEQEVVFLVIRRYNGCIYCLAAHSMLADKVPGVPANVLAATRAGDPLADDKLQALATFTETMIDTRSNPNRAAIDAFLAAEYGEEHIPGIILAIACKAFSNYANHLAGTPVDDRFADYKVD